MNVVPDDSIKMRRARKVVDNGTGPFAIPLAQLTESIITNDKLDQLTEAINSIELPEPQEIEIPEYPTEITVSNLPEIQRVEIVNPPKDKDDKEQLKLLKQIAEELKKKEQYTYDIEVDSNLKEQLRGERGVPGKDGVEITPEEVRDKLSGLEGEERLDISAIKGLKDKLEVKQTNFGRVIRSIRAGTGVTIDDSDLNNPIISATGGSISDTFETVLRDINVYPCVTSYSADNLVTNVVYTLPSGSITETFGYTGRNISTITLSGDTPTGIDLVKTISYTSGLPTSIAYS